MSEQETKPKRPKNPNREKLLQMSADAKSFREKMIQESDSPEDAIWWQSQTLNSILLKYFYKVPEGMELGTFHQWKAQNCLIKKGEKALIIWGQPLRAQRAEQAEAKGQDSPEEDENGEYFPMCYLFRKNQVLTPEEVETEKKSNQERREKQKEIAQSIANLQTVNLDLVL